MLSAAHASIIYMIGLHRPNVLAMCREQGANQGELLPSGFVSLWQDFLKWAKQEKIPLPQTKDIKFVDMGSGIGSVVVTASLLMGVNAHGIEVDPGAVQASKYWLSRCAAALPSMAASLEVLQSNITEADFFQLRPRQAELLASADVVFVNNMLFQDPKKGNHERSINGRLLELFSAKCKVGACIISGVALNPPQHGEDGRAAFGSIKTQKGWGCTVPQCSVQCELDKLKCAICVLSQSVLIMINTIMNQATRSIDGDCDCACH